MPDGSAIKTHLEGRSDQRILDSANNIPVKKTFKLKAKAVPQSKKLKVKRHRKITYESSNKKIATISAKGVIKGVKKGSCKVFAYAQNGVCATIKVTVK